MSYGLEDRTVVSYALQAYNSSILWTECIYYKLLHFGARIALEIYNLVVWISSVLSTKKQLKVVDRHENTL